jgi:hypothetical protein
MLGHKQCTKCCKTKSLTEFSKNKKFPDGLSYWCKSCNAAQSKAWREADYERKILNNRKKCLKSRYNMSIEDYNKILDLQCGKCAVCGNTETAKHQNGLIKHLTIDHCHKTGKIRGLLCDACNRAEGFLKSDPNIVRKLAEYLEKSTI